MKNRRWKPLSIPSDMIACYTKYLVLALLGFAFGCVFSLAISNNLIEAFSNTISIHFEFPLINRSITYKSLTYEFFRLIEADIISFFTVFVFSFSFLSRFVAYLVMSYNGFALGVSSFCIIKSMEYCGFPKMSDFLIYFLLGWLTILFFAIYSYRSLRYKQEFKIADIKMRRLKLLSYYAFSISFLCILIILNVVYIFIL